MRAVCVFCAANESIDERYRRYAAEVGAGMARRGWAVISGGGSVSSMGSLARAARANGGTTVGVIPQALMGWEVADLESDELVVTSDMRSRKAEMDRRSDAFLVLPGGLGTLEEFFEVWVGRSLGMHRKPIVVLDPWEDFLPLRELVSGLVAKGFASPTVAAEVHWTADAATAFDLIEADWRAGEGRGVTPDPSPSGRPDAVLGLESD